METKPGKMHTKQGREPVCFDWRLRFATAGGRVGRRDAYTYSRSGSAPKRLGPIVPGVHPAWMK